MPTTSIILALPALRPDLQPIGLAEQGSASPNDMEMIDRVYADFLFERLPTEQAWWGWQQALLDRVLEAMHDPEENEWKLWPTRRDQLIDLTRWADGQQVQWSNVHPAYWGTLELQTLPAASDEAPLVLVRPRGRNEVVQHRLVFFEEDGELRQEVVLPRSWMLRSGSGESETTPMLRRPEGPEAAPERLRVLVQEQSHAAPVSAVRWVTVAVEEIEVLVHQPGAE